MLTPSPGPRFSKGESVVKPAGLLGGPVAALVVAACLGCASAPQVSGNGPPTPGSISTGEATIVVSQQSPARQTLPDFLGLTGLFRAGARCCNRVRNRLGSFFPGLEAQPELLAISDPANLDSPSPAVAAAADIKAQQDAARQKIKALRYLAQIGCGGCYPDVEQSFLAALDDCTEEVRYEAVEALRKTAGDPCQFCQQDSCCSPAVRKKLNEVGWGIDEKTNCYQEPSPRVRRVARLALARCGGPPPDQPRPEEGPGEEDLPAEPAPEETVAPPGDNPPAVADWLSPGPIPR